MYAHFKVKRHNAQRTNNVQPQVCPASTPMCRNCNATWHMNRYGRRSIHRVCVRLQSSNYTDTERSCPYLSLSYVQIIRIYVVINGPQYLVSIMVIADTTSEGYMIVTASQNAALASQTLQLLALPGAPPSPDGHPDPPAWMPARGHHGDHSCWSRSRRATTPS
jgi:hypothetical protein